MWRPFRRLGRACGLGRVLAPICDVARFFSEPPLPAVPEVFGQGGSQLTSHQRSRGGSGQHGGGGGAPESRRSSSLETSLSASREVRGGGSGSASRPASSAGQVSGRATSPVMAGEDGTSHPRVDPRGAVNANAETHEPRGEESGSRRGSTGLVAWMAVSLRPFVHLTSWTRSFLRMGEPRNGPSLHGGFSGRVRPWSFSDRQSLLQQGSLPVTFFLSGMLGWITVECWSIDARSPQDRSATYVPVKNSGLQCHNLRS